MNNDMRDDFIRQRRNLIISSLVLLFAQFSGLRVDKLIIFGNELKFEHSYSVTTVIWIATCYWAFRFYQYFNELKSTGIKSAYSNKFNSYIPQIAFKKLKETHPDLALPPNSQSHSKIELTLSEYDCIERKRNFERATLSVLIIVKTVDSVSDQEAGPFEVTTNTQHLFKQKILSLLHVLFNTTKFTEYILPLVLFSLCILAGIYLYIQSIWQDIHLFF